MLTLKTVFNAKVQKSRVQEAVTAIMKAGFDLDPEAAPAAASRNIKMADAPGVTFVFRKADRFVTLKWDTDADESSVIIDRGGIPATGASFTYSAQEFLKDQPLSDNDPEMETLSLKLPEKWRKPFLRLVIKGQDEQAFADYFHADETCQAVIKEAGDLKCQRLEDATRRFCNQKFEF